MTKLAALITIGPLLFNVIAAQNTIFVTAPYDKQLANQQLQEAQKISLALKKA